MTSGATAAKWHSTKCFDRVKAKLVDAAAKVKCVLAA
jgi:hypothetical protein